MPLKRDGRLEIQRNLSAKPDPEPIRPRVKSRPIERIPTSEYLEDADPAMLMMPPAFQVALAVLVGYRKFARFRMLKYSPRN